jgi:cytochrome c biogenesis protein CcmG, thiol:disulfide interchange protein DsbE
MGARTFIVFMVVLAVLGLLGYGLLSKGEESLALGETAPDRQITKLDGTGTAKVADYRGKFVLLNFWASWCEPCRAEAPALEDFQKAHQADGFTVLGINLDDTTRDADGFVRKYGLTYPQLRDGDGRWWRNNAYGMTGFPENFLIDPEGKIALIRRGPVDDEYLSRYVAPIISGRAPTVAGS